MNNLFGNTLPTGFAVCVREELGMTNPTGTRKAENRGCFSSFAYRAGTFVYVPRLDKYCQVVECNPTKRLESTFFDSISPKPA